jgi:spore coat protein H
MKKFIPIILLLIFSSDSFPQHYNESWKLFDDTEVARIDISIDSALLDWIYSNVHSDSFHFASMHFKNKYIDETVDSIGFRLRGNTSRESQKKSFKISFNTFITGREFYGVDKLNLNGEHNDPSIIRSKLCWDFYQAIGMKASRASYAEVYINSKYYGLYISVEHIDDEFLKKNYADDSGNLWKCLYPADLQYLGQNPDLYKLKFGDRPVYELKTNEEENDFSGLARLADVINNTPGTFLPDSLEEILDPVEIIKSAAADILTGSWDDYWSNMNNYYLYFEPSERSFHFIPYDYDNTFGIDWFSIDWPTADPYHFPKLTGGARPLVEKILDIPGYKNLYTHFLQYFKENIFKLSLWENRIDSLKNLIRPYAEKDTFRIKDWGFTMNDFDDSYSASHYSNQHVKAGLKEYINTRYSSLGPHLNYGNGKPVVYKIDFSPETPSESDSVYVNVSAFGYPDITRLQIRFIPEDASPETSYDMEFKSITGSKKAEDADRWIGVIPPSGGGNFRIFAENSIGDSIIYPLNESIPVNAYKPAAEGIFINEFMAGNTSTISDSDGQYDDWVELFNPTDSDIILSGMYMTDKPDNLTKWQFPNDSLKIKAGEFLIIWCDEDEGQSGIHTNFKLSAGGEFIGLISPDGVSVIDSISFGSQSDDISCGRFPDGYTNWQCFNMPTPGASNIITGINRDENLPFQFSLTAYPNPLNPSTRIKYTIPVQLDKGNRLVTLRVYDLLGREVAVLVNEKQSAGTYEVEFYAKDLASGIYLYCLNAGNFSLTKKLLLLK